VNWPLRYKGAVVGLTGCLAAASGERFRNWQLRYKGAAAGERCWRSWARKCFLFVVAGG